MAISNNIDAIVATIIEEEDSWNADNTVPTPVSNDVKNKAVKAILGGTQDWVDFMSLFKTTDGELARLIPTDGSTDAVRQEARAYLAANAMCGMGTGRHLKNNVTTKLD
jgi:hypothetical protein